MFGDSWVDSAGRGEYTEGLGEGSVVPDDDGRGAKPEPGTEPELEPEFKAEPVLGEETGSAEAGAEGGGWLVKEKPNINLPYTGRLLLDIVRSRVMMSRARMSGTVYSVIDMLPLWFVAAVIASAAGILMTPRKPGKG